MDADSRNALPDEPTFDSPVPSPRDRRPSESSQSSQRQSIYQDAQRSIRTRAGSSASHAPTTRSSYPSAPAGIANFTSDLAMDRRSLDRRSRPVSSASRGTSRSNVYKRASTNPDEFPDMSDAIMPMPTSAREERPLLDQSRAGTPARNFSKRDPHHSRGTSGTTQDGFDLGFSEPTALPPLPSMPRRASGPPPSASGSKRNTMTRAPDDDHEKSPGLTRSPTAEHLIANPATPVHPLLISLYTHSYLIFFSILGTLARLGVQWITFYPGAPIVTPVVWANFGGSLVLGFLAEDARLFRHPAMAKISAESPEKWDALDSPTEIARQKKSLPLYLGLGVGFCGCFTSFSSFAKDMFLAISNNLPTPVNHPGDFSSNPSYALDRSGGYSVEAFFAVIFTTLALSLGGFFIGGHIASAVQRYTPCIPTKFLRNFLDPVMVLLGFGCWIGAIILAIFPPAGYTSWRGDALFAIVFAPAGCLLRYYASLKLNILVGTFPLGTFAVNMFGTAVEAMCFDIQHVGVGVMGRLGGGVIGCQVLQGIMDGFCGSLTTISTFMAELKALRKKHAYLYAVTSVVGGLCLTLVIMGSVRWSVGWGLPVCSTGYTSKTV